MAVTSNLFDVLVAEYGEPGAYKAIHVCLREWWRPPQFNNDERVICLTVDAIDPDEFAGHIDEIIEQLEALKIRGRRKLAAIAREEAKGRQAYEQEG